MQIAINDKLLQQTMQVFHANNAQFALEKALQISKSQPIMHNSGIEETAYLLRNAKGAQRLLESVEELRAGKGVIRELINDD